MRKGTKVYMIELTVPKQWLERSRASQEAIINKYGKRIAK